MEDTIKNDNMSDFETVIEKILAADEEAKKSADEADNKKRNAIAHISEQKQKLRISYRERADKRIDNLKCQEKTFADEKIEKAAAEHKLRMSKLDEKAAAETEKWADELFNKVISK